MLKGFRDSRTQKLFDGLNVRGMHPDLQRAAAWKLEVIAAAAKEEALRADRAGQHSIRINDQWRPCFTWRNGDAYDVELVDYH